MIVVDTNILAYLYLNCEHTPMVEKLLVRDSHWKAPTLWRSELRNVLTLYMRKKMLTFGQALSIQTEAELLLADNEYDVDSFDILTLVNSSECSAYDCEFVALARRLNTKLVSMDKKILKNFPETALSLTDIMAA